MLPNGRLAKHGYTTKWGFFSGVCRGSGELPLEVSCDLVKQSIVWAGKTHADTLDSVALERASRDRVVMASLYLSGSWNQRGGYTWTSVEVVGYDRIHGAVVVDAATKVRVVGDRDGYAHCDAMYHLETVTLDDAAASLHHRYADYLQAKADQIAGYIAHQTRTVQVWEPRPLFPLK